MNDCKSRILITDGEPAYARAWQDLLETRNYKVLAAQSGQTTIELVASEEPDLILLDSEMHT